jgi:F-type H+-transporting ATPase subunit epsilon
VADQTAERPSQRHGLQVSVFALTRVLFEGPAQEVQAPALQGNVAILPHHAPLLALLRPGELTVTEQEGTHRWAISGGSLQVLDGHVVVLARDAILAEDIGLEQAEQELMQATAAATKYQPDAAKRNQLDQQILWARARVALARQALSKAD